MRQAIRPVWPNWPLWYRVLPLLFKKMSAWYSDPDATNSLLFVSWQMAHADMMFVPVSFNLCPVKHNCIPLFVLQIGILSKFLFSAWFLRRKFVPLWRNYPPFTMRRMLLAIFSAFYIGAVAQTTITPASFPKAGDTLRLATDNNPAASVDPATPPGGSQTWDFSALKPVQTSEIIYRPAAEGAKAAQYPGADLVLISAAGETYYNVVVNGNTGRWENLGFTGTQATLNLAITSKNLPPLVERRAPLPFFDIYQQTSKFVVPFAGSDLPPALLSQIPIKPDSLRFTLNTQRLEVIDGWGTCKIPGGSYSVMRMKRTDYTTPSIDVKVPFVGWIPISGSGGVGGNLGAFLQADTTITYRFYSNNAKEEIAVATMSNSLSEVENVRFKNNRVVAAEEAESPGAANIQAYPNPAVEKVRFECTNLPKGEYTLKIYNIIGKVIWRQNYNLSGNYSIPLNLDKFSKGTYLYSLVDGKGHTVGTKRLVILKP